MLDKCRKCNTIFIENFNCYIVDDELHCTICGAVHYKLNGEFVFAGDERIRASFPLQTSPKRI